MMNRINGLDKRRSYGFFILPILCILLNITAAYSQAPPIEPGVSHELAIWRAAHYSDVRYKLNLTLEKMSPVLKGTIEIRLKVNDTAAGKSSPPYEGGVDAALGGRGGSLPPIILDWRKIAGYEKDSAISNVSINGTPAIPMDAVISDKDTVEVFGPRFIEKNDHLIFQDHVFPGENVIKLDFTSPILTSGSAITRYVDKEDGAEYIYSLFVPSDASTAFPVFDQPDLKARFQLDVGVPGNWKVVSNSAEEDYHAMRRGADGKVIGEGFSFEETGPISTYLFAFAAGEFAEYLGQKSKSDIPPRINIRTDSLADRAVALSRASATNIYVRKSQAAKFKPHAAEVFRLTREGIKYLETYFDYKFPFPKYDLVLIPEFPFGGMEHAGATFLRESSVIFPTEPTKSDQISRANLIFHETAHQWFGDTVTMRWFDDLWLKEGFAEFMAYKTLEKVMPEANAWKVFYERNKQAAYLTDSTRGTTPIYQEIANLSAAKSAYGNIVYRKAPSFLRQAEFYLGEDKFQTAVRAFLKKHEFANAGWEDLVKEFEAACGQDLKEWAKQWVTQRGLPVYRVQRTHDDPNTYEVTIIPNDALRSGGVWQMKVRTLAVTSNVNGRTDPTALLTMSNGRMDPYRMSETISDGTQSLYYFFPNYQDYGYGIFLLDDKSRDYILKNIGREKDDFLRTMMWGSLWDSVREGELDPKDYVELVIKNLTSTPLQKPARSRGIESPGETDEGTIQTLLSRVSTAMNYYLSDAQRAAIAPRLESLLIDRMQHASTPGQRITYYRAFVSNATTEKGRAVLKEMLRQGGNPSGSAGVPSVVGTQAKNTLPAARVSASIPLKTKDRFDIVTRLIILGDPEAPKLLADLEKTETGDDAKRYAYAARAGTASAENKAKYWNDFINNKDISESWIEAAFGPFNSVKHSDLTLPYLEKALAELPNLKRNRKIFFVNGWLGAFIGGQRSEAALAIVNKFLADNPNLDKDLRLKILENVDLIERAVKIRKKFARE